MSFKNPIPNLNESSQRVGDYYSDSHKNLTSPSKCSILRET